MDKKSKAAFSERLADEAKRMAKSVNLMERERQEMMQCVEALTA